MTHTTESLEAQTGQGASLILGAIVLNCWVVLGMAVAQSGPLAGNPWGTLLFLGATALAALAAPFLAGRLKSRAAMQAPEGAKDHEHDPVSAATALAVLAGVLFLAGFATENGAVAMLGMLFLGICCGLAEVVVFVRLAEFGPERVAPAVAFVTLAAAVATVPFDLLPVEWSYTLFAMAPLLMVPLLFNETPGEHGWYVGGAVDASPTQPVPGQTAQHATGPGSFAAKLILANLLVTTTFNLLLSEALVSLPWQGWLSIGRLLANVLVCAALLAALVKVKRLDVATLYRVVIPIMVLGLLILSAIPSSLSPVAIVCVSMGYSVFDACTWIVLTQITHTDRRTLARAGSLYVATSFAGMVLANGMLTALSATGATDLGQNTPSILLAVLVLVVGIMLVLPQRKPLDERGPENTSETDADASAASSTPAAAMETTLACLAENAGLTNREREVLLLLAQGRTSTIIAREMGVAEGTAHTHIMHVYQKLGVHSQQELLDLVHGSMSD